MAQTVMMKRRWTTGLAALALAVASFAIGFGARSGSDDFGLPDSRMARMVVAGSMQERVREHRQLLEQIRSSMSPAMRQRLEQDRLWQMMRGGGLEELMDELGEIMRGVPGMRDFDAGTNRGAPIH